MIKYGCRDHASGELPVLNNQGAELLWDFVDTGINYMDPLFRKCRWKYKNYWRRGQTLPAASYRE